MRSFALCFLVALASAQLPSPTPILPGQGSFSFPGSNGGQQLPSTPGGLPYPGGQPFPLPGIGLPNPQMLGDLLKRLEEVLTKLQKEIAGLGNRNSVSGAPTLPGGFTPTTPLPISVVPLSGVPSIGMSSVTPFPPTPSLPIGASAPSSPAGFRTTTGNAPVPFPPGI